MPTDHDNPFTGPPSLPTSLTQARPPHPAKVVQPKPAIGGAVARPPHPATVVQPKPATGAHGAVARPPHPATVVQQKPATGAGQSVARPPHPATVVQPKHASGGGVVRAPHPATVSFPSSAPIAWSATTPVAQRAVAHAYDLQHDFIAKPQGAAGGFNVQRQFKLNPKAKAAGYVLQRITRAFALCQKYTLNATGTDYDLVNAGPDTINANAFETWVDYWEVFPVQKDDVNPDNNDQFQLTTMAWDKSDAEKKKCKDLKGTAAAYAYTTKGVFTQQGDATFYEGDWKTLGFKKLDAGPPNGLFGKKGPIADPGPAATPRSNTLVYSVTSTWDSKTNTGNVYGKAVLT